MQVGLGQGVGWWAHPGRGGLLEVTLPGLLTGHSVTMDTTGLPLALGMQEGVLFADPKGPLCNSTQVPSWHTSPTWGQ